MELKDKFMNMYESLQQTVQKRSERQLYIAMGYSSNLDLILNYDSEMVSSLLAEHLKNADLTALVPAKRIRTMEELLSTIVYYCRNGIGGEVDIEETGLLKDHFVCENAMGGTAVQAAMALAEMNASSIVHLTDDSPEVCGILDSPFISAVSDDGRLERTGCISGHNPQEPHFILQFKKGDLLRLNGQTVRIPASNRLILTKVTINDNLPFHDPYFRWIEDHARLVSSSLLSSFNAITDPEILKDRLEYVRRHVQIYHERNPQGTVYYEDAHYHDDHVRKLCIETLFSSVDVLGMNEEELKSALEDIYGYHVDLSDVLSCAAGAEYLQKQYGVRRAMVVHTKDYAMYLGPTEGRDIETGLIYGLTMATAKAAFGQYGGEKEIREVLKLSLSETGLRNAGILADSPFRNRAVLVPTLYIDKPKYTIGLGDSFTGGLQLCF